MEEKRIFKFDFRGRELIVEVGELAKQANSACLVRYEDTTIVNREGIQKLGAKGIVEIDNQLKIILGSEAKQLKKYINELK